jgi:hypothetical protein
MAGVFFRLGRVLPNRYEARSQPGLQPGRDGHRTGPRARLLARVWVCSRATDEYAKVLARSLGIRDLALGAAGVLALRERDREWLRRSFAAQAVADAVDFVMLAAGRDVPLASRLVWGTLAADSAAVACVRAPGIEIRRRAA